MEDLILISNLNDFIFWANFCNFVVLFVTILF